jgi:hypothetical protein
LKAFQDGIIDDLGGIAEMDTFQLSMLDRATECLIILRHMAEHVEDKGITDHDGQLAPCLRQSYVSYLNSFRLTMDSIYSRNGKKPRRTPSLADIISGKDE